MSGTEPVDASKPAVPPSFQTGFLAQPMGPVGLVVFGLYFAIVSIVAMQLLIGVWPVAGQANAGAQVRILWGIAIDFNPGLELRLSLLAVLSGALGSFVHAATSFTTYLGNRQFIRSWAGWYALRPFIGMALALILYYVIRAGFVVAGPASAGTADANINPYGIAAVGGLAGMFSKQAADKLEEVFRSLLKPPAETDEQRRDKLKPAEPGENKDVKKEE